MSETSRRELEQLIEERVAAVRRQDAATLLQQHDDQVLTFPLLPPTASRGREAIGASLDRWFEGYADGPGYEVHDLVVEAADDLGCCAFFYHVTGTLTTGDIVDMWVRSTVVFRRQNEGWRLVHAHESVPFDAATGRALISERPPEL
ncbi:MAG TPA: nuclear transport factor 2 family protein [Microlunatus sp.]